MIPLIVYRVYADGRPDELVRGVDIVGTPLASFARILATSDKAEVFNGYCGAESGSVPVSAVSPAILVSELEIQKKGKGATGRRSAAPPIAQTASGARIEHCSVSSACAALFWRASDAPDALFQAMKDELERSRTLQFSGLDKPYYIEYTVEDHHGYSVSAIAWRYSCTQARVHVRIPRTRVRVGEYRVRQLELHVQRLGASGEIEHLPLDDNYAVFCGAASGSPPTRHTRAQWRRSRGSGPRLKNMTQPEAVPDFWKAETGGQNRRLYQRNSTLLATRGPNECVACREVFSAYPEVLSSVVSRYARDCHVLFH